MQCSEGPVKNGVLYLWINNISNVVLFFLPIVLLFLCALLLNVVGLLCIVLLLVCASLFTDVYCFTVCVLL